MYTPVLLYKSRVDGGQNKLYRYVSVVKRKTKQKNKTKNKKTKQKKTVNQT